MWYHWDCLYLRKKKHRERRGAVLCENQKGKKMKLYRIGYGAVGVLLAISVVLTGSYGLAKVDREIYKTAMGIEEQMQENGFTGFMPSEMKVRFFDGTKDYVVADGKVTKEEAAFDTFVGTTSKIDGEYQVILPAYDNFSQMFSLLDTAQGVTEGEMDFAENTYTTNAHVATLWHEAFHAWQMTNWENEVNEACVAAGFSPEDNMTDIIRNEVDSNDKLVVSFSREMELLRNAYETADVEEKKQLIIEALNVADERKAMVSAKAAYAEEYFQMVEGTARYVEARAYLLLEGDAAWKETYFGDYTYEKGNGKYYEMGMYKCLLLDELMPEWKDGYCVTDSLDNYLRSAVEA